MSLFGHKVGMLVAVAAALTATASDSSAPRKYHHTPQPLPKKLQEEKIRLANEKRARKAAKRVNDAVKQV
jgi:hypothetical protein